MNDLGKLAAAAQDGDESALTLLLEDLQNIFRGFFIRRIGSRAEVDDLVQNSLVRVSTSLVDLRDPSRLKGFAMKAALFELQDYFRGRYSAKETLFDELAPSEGSTYQADAAATIDVERALAQLSPKARQIIELREYGYRYEEIADMVGTTEAAVKMQVKRAFDKLRQLISVLWWMIMWSFLSNSA
ncbi:MAG: RNA polymerase sigma factor [Bacteroidetes bacterium]|nr:MAG: RNA polymerase sigma factor [Bacteroidota bacterium]